MKNSSIFETKFGLITLIVSEAGLKRIVLKKLRVHIEKSENEILKQARNEIKSYLKGEIFKFSIPLDLSEITDFQSEVYKQVRLVPYGTTVSYTELATRLGSPEKRRAVGMALARNPLPIVIPCHRIVRLDKSLGGFTGGLEWKKNLLKIERDAFCSNR